MITAKVKRTKSYKTTNKKLIEMINQDTLDAAIAGAKGAKEVVPLITGTLKRSITVDDGDIDSESVYEMAKTGSDALDSVGVSIGDKDIEVNISANTPYALQINETGSKFMEEGLRVADEFLKAKGYK